MGTLSEARVKHATHERLRLKIPGRRGDTSFFDMVTAGIVKETHVTEVRCNPRTGSVLCLGSAIDIGAVAQLGETAGLFSLSQKEADRRTMSHRVAGALNKADKDIGRFTAGELDLSSLVFVSLLGVGVYQLIRGNLTAPPWYTAFWYAFGVFTKTVADGFQEKRPE